MISNDLLKLIGMNVSGWLQSGTNNRIKPVWFASATTLHVHLDQLNTTDNMKDGAPSIIVEVVSKTAVKLQAFIVTQNAGDFRLGIYPNCN